MFYSCIVFLTLVLSCLPNCFTLAYSSFVLLTKVFCSCLSLFCLVLLLIVTIATIPVRSGKEGRWPNLESRCEQRLSEVFPKSRLLRVATSLLKPGALDEETRKNVDQDITVSRFWRYSKVS